MIGITLVVAAGLLLPSIQHFVPPLHHCLLADICNHTWVPECGAENRSAQGLETDFRVFIDECDLMEYNCDYNKNYELTNYSDCFPPICFQQPERYKRVGNYKVMEGRRLIYAPVQSTWPMHMLHGKRRWTPQPGRKLKKSTPTIKTLKTVKTQKTHKKTYPKKVTKQTSKINRLRESNVLQRITVMKNGRVFIKVVKGILSRSETQSTRQNLLTEHDSDFLE